MPDISEDESQLSRSPTKDMINRPSIIMPIEAGIVPPARTTTAHAAHAHAAAHAAAASATAHTPPPMHAPYHRPNTPPMPPPMPPIPPPIPPMPTAHPPPMPPTTLTGRTRGDQTGREAQRGGERLVRLVTERVIRPSPVPSALTEMSPWQKRVEKVGRGATC